MQVVEITRPDDWHLHLRDGAALNQTVAASARVFGRVIVMPNLRPPVTTVDEANSYRERILAALPANHANSEFDPLMTLYLTDSTPPSEISAAAASNAVRAVKFYPAGATTNSDSGVTSLKKVYPTLEAMQKHDLPLLLHGEVTDPTIDIFD